jgi:hypothetical protein
MSWHIDEDDFVYVSPKEQSDGQWVKYDDYARLKAECQARQAENSVLAVECDSLKAQVERLTKAGDAMIHEWSSGEESDVDNFTKALWLWSLAKKGGQS